MAIEDKVNSCVVCNKSRANLLCTGCKKYFCSIHVKEHEQQLLKKFNNEIVRSHDELLEQIQKFDKSDSLSVELFKQIEQWKETSIKKIQIAAEKAHHELNELIRKQKTNMIKQFEPLAKNIRAIREQRITEDDINQLKEKIDALQKKLQSFNENNKRKNIVVENDQIDWNQLIYIREPLQDATSLRVLNVNINAKWIQNGVTVAGGNGHGNALNQLYDPGGLYVTDDQTIYVVEKCNHRVTEWKPGATSGRVIFDGGDHGNGCYQLYYPADVALDKKKHCLILCDKGNRRVVRCPIKDAMSIETIISDVKCIGLAIDEDDFIYVSDFDEHVVRRYRVGDSQGIVVAGGNGEGNRLDQLNNPSFIFVDGDRSIYVTDSGNHRVMKWLAGATAGIVVAGNNGCGNKLKQLSSPGGLAVDQSGNVYVVDQLNRRIMRWAPNATEGTIIIGENGSGNRSDQLKHPHYLSFDKDGNFYVSDITNHSVQKFYVDKSS